MTHTTIDEALAPLEQLHLRDVLQELWRLQVRRITLLSLAMYDELDAEDRDVIDGQAATCAAVEDPLTEARQALTALEDGMRRLDDGSYGRCASCGAPIGYAALLADPLAAACVKCRPPRLGPGAVLTATSRCGG